MADTNIFLCFFTNINTEVFNISLIFFTYCIISFITSHEFFEKDKKLKIIFNKESFFSSFIALLLSPLFFKSIGNDLLKNILLNKYSSYDYMLFISYVTVISLAGKKVISSVLANLNLNEVNKKIKKQQKSIDVQEEIQNEIVIKSIEDDEDSNKNINGNINEILCSLVNYNHIIEVNNENIESLKKLHKQRYISPYSNIDIGNVKFSITRLGRKYFEILNKKD